MYVKRFILVKSCGCMDQLTKQTKVLGLLKRTVGTKNKEIFSVLYRSLVRPLLLEYTSPVWSPYLVKDKLAIESIQRRASRIAVRQKDVRCLTCMKRDANCWAGEHVSIEEITSLWQNVTRQYNLS